MATVAFAKSQLFPVSPKRLRRFFVFAAKSFSEESTASL